MDTLKDALIEYRLLTEKIGIYLDNENYDNLNRVLDKREELITFIGTLKYTIEEFNSICREIQLDALDKNVNASVLKRQEELKQNMIDISRRRNANNTYVKRFNADSIFFNKKV